ncbi:MAG: hypothetical protein E7276_11855 [Pseudobutyrivibrio sp.]|nr:hypothetical protein [Pseudobutyrivibrio sp.]
MKKLVKLLKEKRIICSLVLALLVLYSPMSIVVQASESYSNTLCAYKNLLSAQEIAVYNQVYSAILDYNSSLFRLEEPLLESDLEDTMNALFNDHPELFWVNTAYKYAVDSNNVVHKIQLNFGISESDFTNVQASYENAVKTIVSEAAAYSSAVDREKYIYDKICSMNTYNECSAMNQSAYSALTSGSSVCAGYARAFQIACLQSGIPCYYVTGTSRGQNHAWNIVQIDGKYYNVDLTWDDCLSETLGYNSYYYFNKNDLEFSLDHSRSALSSQLVSCVD